MDLTIYDVILGPVVTDKAYKLNRDYKQSILRVHPHANKPMIKQALERLFNVQVRDVRISVRKGKVRRVGRKTVVGSKTKKAIVTLAPGYSLDFFEQTSTSVPRSHSAVRVDKDKKD
jgi:large subunit ribosomal protein L23